jgi:arylsulfatase A-like enzyme
VRSGALVCAALLASAAASARAAPSSPSPRNLILVSVDTLRADRLGCYGNRRPTSPAIDRIAAEGIVFDDASAPSPWTKPSHASLFTGRYPSAHGAGTMSGELRADVPHLAEWLARRGYETVAVVNSLLLRQHGLERGFARLDYVPFVQGERRSSPVTERATARLGERDTTKPLFLFVHYMDVHSDYASLPRYESLFARPYDGFADGTTQQLYRHALDRFELGARDVEHLIDLYDAGIRQVDDQIDRLLRFLDERGMLDSSLLVLLSDHGEEFLEHGGVLHGHSQYQELVRVPLVLRGAGLPRGVRIPEPVSLLDVLPTVLALLGVPAPAPLDGIDLQPLWTSPERALPPRLLFYEADVTFPPPAPGIVPAGTHRAVREGRFKFHYDLAARRAGLFDLSADPREQVDRIDAEPQKARELSERLRSFLERGRGSEGAARGG